ncbi:jg8243 [Pararge aegeria aegeria]|uniref:Jg8243 protein n=3 Tax=Pararge aegeria TaxID=116150 RepID=A0A8S4RSF9_9NEOP|nr:jg8243 [Pararge aegeria aegeria]
MDNQNSPERSVPIQYVRASRAFRQFKNPPQPHMCIQDTIKDTSEKLFINVLGWQKIANPKQYSDPIPLYGGMQVHQGCGLNSNRPPLLVFAVMVNPDILKANGKNASNPTDREALVSLLCDFVEAMNPGLALTRNPVILKDRDLAGELKDVWLAVQTKREREKGLNQDVMYKVYDIDGIGCEDPNDDEQTNGRNKQYDNNSPNRPQNCEKRKYPVKSSKQILKNAGQKSEFDSGMNNCQLNQNNLNRDNRCGNTDQDTTYCTPVYGQIVSTRENHNEINEIQQKFATNESVKPSSSYRNDWQPCKQTQGMLEEAWDEVSNKDISSKPDGDVKTQNWDDYSIQNMNMKQNEGEIKKQKSKTEKTKPVTNGKSHFDFYPVFDNKTVVTETSDNATGRLKEQNKDKSDDDNSKIIIDPMQKLVLHSTDNKICDNKTSALSSYSS